MRIAILAFVAIVLFGVTGARSACQRRPLEPGTHQSSSGRSAHRGLSQVPYGADRRPLFRDLFSRPDQFALWTLPLGSSKASLCNSSGCLHQIYKLTCGHYRLVKSFYGPVNI